ncbi:MAG TPA: dihydropteroate synthase [Blastocatellia bacterium]|jgi:dihydropteroate synthase|nr:dihydropteroate synthase [Blastocatellia bacterium]
MRTRFTIPLRNGSTLLAGERTLVVGVLNVTPDSFSDGGRHFDTSEAIDHALKMQGDGADIIEIGGESTRPGAKGLSVEEELARILPVLTGLGKSLQVPLSVDTSKSEVARAALDLGVSIINDVSALRFDPKIADVALGAGAALVFMHMRGTPEIMQKMEPSPDIFAEIAGDFEAAIAEAESRGVGRDRIILDPGIGFGKTQEQNLDILNHLDRFDHFNLALMVGTSRKSFIGRITGREADERAFGTAASVAVSIARGAHLVRVHDVKEMVEVARVADAIINT